MLNGLNSGLLLAADYTTNFTAIDDAQSTENVQECTAASRTHHHRRLLAKFTLSIVRFNGATSARQPDFGFSPGVPML
jgi:hypothetical protein